MKLSASSAESASRHALLRTLMCMGFRIFFTLAALWSVFAMTVWMVIGAGWIHWESSRAPVWLHGHEMMFGFTAAAAAGFLLSATPVWSKTPPLTGLPLQALVAAWLCGRLGAVPGLTPDWFQSLADVVFFVGLLSFLTPTLWFTGNRIHRIFPLLVGLMALGDLLTHLQQLGITTHTLQAGLLLGVNAIVFFLAMTGGHIMPMFTRDALKSRGEEADFSLSIPLEIAGVVTLTLMVITDLWAADQAWTGWILLAAGVIQAWRLARWHGHKTFDTPLLWVLHLGYLWLVIGLLLRGIARLDHGLLAESTALHALTVGAMGLFTLGIMARVSLAHTGRLLTAPPPLTLAFWSITLAAILRVFFVSHDPALVILLAGGLWIVGYLLFCMLFLPILSTPRPDGQPG